jgi:protein-disulfide isomerase
MPTNNQKIKAIASLVFLVLIVSGGLFYIYYQNVSLQQKYNADNLNFKDRQLSLLSEQPEDFTLGSKDPKVRLVVYTDTDCQFCERYEPDLIKTLMLHEDISITYRNFNLPIYPYSRFEHQTLECIGILTNPVNYQKFQNEQLFNHKASKDADIYRANLETAELYLTPYGETIEDLQACIDDPKTTERLHRKKEIGLLLGVTSTPTTFAIKRDGEIKKLVGSYSYKNLMYNLRILEPSL